MNTGIVKSKASGLALMGKVLVAVVVLGAVGMPQVVHAKTTDDQFKQFLTDMCISGLYGPLPASATQMCFDFQNGLAAAGGFAASSNAGTANAGSGSASRNKKGVRERLDERKTKPEKGASSDDGRWGVLVTPQYGKSERVETDLENGYQSNLKGLVLGLDYRFSDDFVLGVAIGHTKDEANFVNNVGYLKTSNTTATMYGTWVATEKVAVDGYLGYGKLSLENQRNLTFGVVSGPIHGKTSGRQVMAGASTSYQTEIGKVSVAPFINFDYIKSAIDGYSETGATLLEFRYADRSIISSTSSLGLSLGTSNGYDWGILHSSVRLATVHEFQNKANPIRNELVVTPGIGFSVQTDTPDRNYLNFGLGVSAALNDGAQLFLDFEKRTQDRLLRSWAVSLGGLFEF